MKIRDIMLMELPILMRCYSRSGDEMIMNEYFCQCCLSQYEHPEHKEYYQNMLRTLLSRHITRKSGLKIVEQIVKFCYKHPKQAILYARQSDALKNIINPSKKDILAVSNTVL